MIDIELMDKIQQLDEIESFFPLSKTRNFYLKKSCQRGRLPFPGAGAGSFLRDGKIAQPYGDMRV